MGKLKEQVREEFKQLPLMLGKLLGGIATVIGFATAVWIMTRNPNSTIDDALFPLLFGTAGILAFVLSGRELSRQSAKGSESTGGGCKSRMNLLTWTLFLLLSGVFLIFCYLLTR